MILEPVKPSKFSIGSSESPMLWRPHSASKENVMFHAPYIECPYCGKMTFGICIIADRHYTRRCNSCWRPKGYEPSMSFPLPALHKKVIYLDQHGISNMMKSLNPATKAFRKGNLDPFWRDLFARLDVLAKMQLIICPDSTAHTEESVLAPYFKELKRTYELLSHGTSFWDFHQIKLSQVSEHARNWISETDPVRWDFAPQPVIHGTVNGWKGHFYVSLPQAYMAEQAPELRATRRILCRKIGKIFQRWQNESNRKLDDWIREESAAFGEAVLETYQEHLQNLGKNCAEGAEPTLDEILGPRPVDFVLSVRRTLERANVPEDKCLAKVVEYFRSQDLCDIPFIRIEAMMWAGLAKQAATGRNQPPSQGMSQDIDTISTLLPYCDAMFIDKECHAILDQMVSRIPYPTEIFSLRNKQAFLEYLQSIENDASEEHLCALAEVYGTRQPKPYLDMFE